MGVKTGAQVTLYSEDYVNLVRLVFDFSIWQSYDFHDQ